MRSDVSEYMTFIKFLTSGGISALVQLGMLYVLVTYLSLWYLLAAAFAYVVAFGVNFSLQKWFSFRESSIDTLPKQLVKFALLATGNGVVNLVYMYLLVTCFQIPYLTAQIVIICVLAIVNFFLSRRFIFISKTPLR